MSFKIKNIIIALIPFFFAFTVFADGAGGNKCDNGGDGCNDKGDCGCKGAPKTELSRDGKFKISDIPIWYETAIGPDFELLIRYKPHVFRQIANDHPLGDNWSVKYLDLAMDKTGSTIHLYYSNGSGEEYVLNNSKWEEQAFTHPDQGFLGSPASGRDVWIQSDDNLVVFKREDGEHIAFEKHNAEYRLSWIADELGDRISFFYEIGNDSKYFDYLVTADERRFNFEYHSGFEEENAIINGRLKSVEGPMRLDESKVPGVTGKAQFEYTVYEDQYFDNYTLKDYVLLTNIIDMGGRDFSIDYENKNINGESWWKHMMVPYKIKEINGDTTMIKWFGERGPMYNSIAIHHPDQTWEKVFKVDTSKTTRYYSYWNSKTGSLEDPVEVTYHKIIDGYWQNDPAYGQIDAEGKSSVVEKLSLDGMGTDSNGETYSRKRPYLANAILSRTEFDAEMNPLGEKSYIYYSDSAQLNIDQDALTDLYQKYGHLYQEITKDKTGAITKVITYKNISVDSATGELLSQEVEVKDGAGVLILYRKDQSVAILDEFQDKFPTGYPYNKTEKEGGELIALEETLTDWSEVKNHYYSDGKLKYVETRFGPGPNDFNVDMFYVYHTSGNAIGEIHQVYTPGDLPIQLDNGALATTNGLNKVTHEYGFNGHVKNTVYSSIDSSGVSTDFETIAYKQDIFYRNISAHYSSDDTFELWSYSCCGISSYTERDGCATVYDRDQRKRVVREVKLSPSGRKIFDNKYELDVNDNRLSVVDIQGAKTVMKYDKLNRLVEMTDGVGRKTEYGYDVNGNRYFVINPNGLVVRSFFDDSNNEIHVVKYANREDAKLENVEVLLADTTPLRADDNHPYITSKIYDSADRLEKIFDAYKHDSSDFSINSSDYSKRFVYDLAGRITHEYTSEDSGERYTRFEFGFRNEILKRYGPILTGQAEESKDLRLENLYDQIGKLIYAVSAEYIPENDSLLKFKRVTNYDYDTRIDQISSINSATINATQAINVTNLESLSYVELSSKSYDNQARVLTSIREGLEEDYSYSFEDNGLNKTEVGFQDNSKSTNYFECHLLVKSVDRNDVETIYEYNDFNQLVEVKSSQLDSEGNAIGTTRAYDRANRILSEANHLGHTKKYSYNEIDQVTVLEFEDGSKQYREYNLNGQMVSVKGANTYPIRYEYDALDRRIKMIDGNNSETSWSYTQTGQVKRKWYDGSEVNSPDLEYIYDKFGQLIQRTDKRGVITKYWYDNLNRLRGTDYPAWDAETEVATSEYRNDLVNFLTEPLLNEDVRIVYDSLGRKSQVTGPTGTTDYSYEGVSQRVTSEDGPFGIVSKTYENGDLNELFLGTDNQNSNYLVDYGFNNGRLVSVAYNGHSIAYNYVPNSNLIDSVSFNTDDLVSSRTYDDANRWMGISHVKKNLPANDFSAKSYVYLLDSQGRRIQRTITKGGEDFVTAYGYNNKSEVISADYSYNFPVAVQRYRFRYDEIGNRTLNRQNDLEIGGTYNSLNQAIKYNYSGEMPYAGTVAPQSGSLTSVTVDGQDAGVSGELSGQIVVKNGKKLFVLAQDDQGRKSSVAKEVPNQKGMTYDLNGNLKADGTWMYYWNQENRLIRMDGAETRLVFAYDDMGRRIKKQVYSGGPGSWVLSDEKRFLYDDWNMIVETDESNAWEKAFVWGLDVSGVMLKDGGVGGLLMMRVNGGSDYFYEMDINGNVVGYVDATTLNLVTEYAYSPFGKVISSQEDIVNPYIFSTKYEDTESDMLYYGYRYYSGVLGKWINRDPIEEDGGDNVYGFVENNPTEKLDFLGLAGQGQGHGGTGSRIDPGIIPRQGGEWSGKVCKYKGSFYRAGAVMEQRKNQKVSCSIDCVKTVKIACIPLFTYTYAKSGKKKCDIDMVCKNGFPIPVRKNCTKCDAKCPSS